MKLTVFILLTACLTASATGHGQTITLSVKNGKLSNVFDAIEKQTGYSFIYGQSLVNQAKPVSIEVKNESLPKVLDLIFRDQPLSYKISDTYIVISPKTISSVTSEISQKELSSTPIDISGRISNEQGEPLSGASVIIKRTGRGDIADVQGDFHLKDVTNDDYIIISFAGYKTQTIKVGSITKFTIVMQVTDNDLDKVVVQAYGTTTQRLATGDITTVKAEQIERQPVMNALAALEGQVPGLVVQQNNGYASSPFKIELRGRSVIDPNSPPSEPLYIIDGVPLMVLNLSNSNYGGGSSGFLQSNNFSGPAGGQSPFFSVNPSDIESITVLKDADATAIYGSRGANGVIIITTKKGTVGKSKLDVNVYQGVSEVTGKYQLLNTQQYIAMREEAFKNDGIAMNNGNAYDILLWDTTRYTDWQKFLWGQAGHTTDAEINFSGGSKQDVFRISSSFHKETSILSRSGSDQRETVQFNYIHRSLDRKLNMSLTNFYSLTQSDLLYLGGSATDIPDAPDVLNGQGYLNWTGWQPVPGNLSFYSTLFQPYNSKTGFLNSQLKVDYTIFSALDLSVQFGYSTMHNANYRLIPIISQNPNNNPKGQATFGSTNNNNAIIEPQLNYSKIILKGKLDILLGESLQSINTDAGNVTGIGFVNDNLLQSVGNAPTQKGSNGKGQYKYEASFVRINYNWKNKYLLTLSGRRDGSSRFGPGKQFGNFGAVGAAWLLSEERWFKKDFPFLSFGKVRLSYGTTGNDQIVDYGYLTQWSSIYSFPYQGSPAYLPLQHSNPELQWEVNKKLEAALNLNFFKDRLTTEISLYRNRCGNQLISQILPVLTGFSSVTANSKASVQNSGVEIILAGKIISNKNISWALNFNMGINRNKLLAFPDLDQSAYASFFAIGQPLNIVRKLHYKGVDPLTGQYTFEDKNKDGQITNSYNKGINDLYLINLNVKYSGGFGSEFSYKGLNLSLFFVYSKQILPSTIYSNSPGVIGYNQSVAVLDHWKKVGDKSKFARYTTQPTTSDFNFYNSDGIYSDGSFIRLRNVTIGYDLPNKLIRRFSIDKCNLYLRGQNLFVITKYEGVDPEAPSLGALPPAKIFTGGIQIFF